MVKRLRGRALLAVMASVAGSLGVAAPGYGAQWVGASGGTGKQHLAATITVAAGQTVAAPVIKMDRAGSITGRVTTASGAAAANGWAGVVPIVHGSGEIPAGASGFDADGRYTLDNLGPYDWQLFFTVFGEAPQFSGGVANRLLARSIGVTVGGTSTMTSSFVPGCR